MPEDILNGSRPGSRLDAVLAEIEQAREQGQAIDVQHYIDRYPDLAEPLRGYIRDYEWFARVAPRVAPTTTYPGAPMPQPEVPLGSRIGGYEVLKEVGRGGRGIVYRVSDPELNRSLAVKVLRPELRDEPDAVRGFLEEAQVTGQLQHPGIVPVHTIGRLPDGRPYLVMKLVQGRTLAELLAERPAPDHEIPRFLGIFNQVCEAVAYAHSRGVIHRDLKPANVMVGAFAEVQVMDWGMAKVLAPDRAGREAPNGEAAVSAPRGHDTIRTVRTETSGLSSADGLVAGTFAYMSPEQARGCVGQLDERADVFGLGAVLSEVLTGRPPYSGAPGWKLHLMAEAGDLSDAFARLDRCGADAELTALARDCLAAERPGRPRDAGAVAQRVAAYLTGVQERLRRAELERAAAEARAIEERKRRRVMLALAAALLLLIAGGGGGLWWAQQRRQATDSCVSRLMGEANLLYEQAQREPLTEGRKFNDAAETASKAQQLADDAGASAALRREAAALAEKLEAEAGAAARDAVLLAAVLEVRGPCERPTYRRDDKALMVTLSEPSADEQFQAAFQAWGLDVDTTPVAEAAARLKDRPAAVVTELIAALDEWTSERRRLRRPEAEWRRLADLAQALDGDPGSRRRQLRELLARGNLARERGLSALSAALRPVPVPFDVGWGPDRGHLRRLAAEVDPAAEPVLGILTLARALQAAGEDALAERVLRAAVRVRPREVVLYGALGHLLTGQPSPRWGQIAECYIAARVLRPGLGESLANALVQSGQVGEGLALYERLVTEQPDNPWLHFRQGHALSDQGRHKEAAAACREAIRLQPDLPGAHNNLGIALRGQGRYKEAEAAYREAIRLKPDYPEAHSNLGNALSDQGRHKEAEAACREAIRLQPDLPQAHINLGAALSRQDRFEEVEAAYREAIRLQPDLPVAHNGLGAALSGQGRHKEAEAACREAIRLQPDYPKAQVNLGNALGGQGRFQEAEAAYREAIRLEPDFPQAHSNLGVALGNQGRFPEAEAAYRDAIRLKPDYANAHDGLGVALGGQGRFPEAGAAYRDAIRLKPDLPLARCHLGHALRDQGHFIEALKEMRRGHALGKKRPDWHYPSADWVRECERLVELDRKLPAVLRGEAAPPTPAECLELALFCQLPCKRQHAHAARLYADAFAADPKLAADLQRQQRYNAACSAALAADGKGEDAQHLADKVRLMLRRQALGWLRDDLTAWSEYLGKGAQQAPAAVEQTLQHWQTDPDLASVRDKGELAKLPIAERDAWAKLWADVETLRNRARENK
jgi:serine/threonine-protein kinase